MPTQACALGLFACPEPKPATLAKRGASRGVVAAEVEPEMPACHKELSRFFLAAGRLFRQILPESRDFASQHQQDARDDPGQLDSLRKLHSRLAGLAARVSKVKRSGTSPLNKYMPKRLLREACEAFFCLRSKDQNCSGCMRPLVEPWWCVRSCRFHFESLGHGIDRDRARKQFGCRGFVPTV